MKNTIIFITVFFSTVFLSFSIKCYQCDPSNKTTSSECKNGDFCVIEIKRRGDADYNLACVGPGIDDYDCEKDSYLCNFCLYDDCNKPPKRSFHSLQQCVERYFENLSSTEMLDYKTPEIFNKMSNTFTRKFCGSGQKCMTAYAYDGNALKKLYTGCTILPSDELATRYNFTGSTNCSNKPLCKGREMINNTYSCYECYTGPDKENKENVFWGLSSCDEPSSTLCGPFEECAKAFGKTKGGRFQGCMQDDEDTLRKKFDFGNVTLCNTSYCNNVEEVLKCYVCHGMSCLHPHTTLCRFGRCVTASKHYSSASRFHGCIAGGDKDAAKYCKQNGYKDDCQICHNKNLCNEVARIRCYDCYTSDGRGSVSDTVFKGKPNCSNPSITNCASNQECAHAFDEQTGKQFHGCMIHKDEECSKSGFSYCSFCDDDICNEVTVHGKNEQKKNLNLLH